MTVADINACRCLVIADTRRVIAAHLPGSRAMRVRTTGIGS
jgi:hypothetical protein